MSESKGSAVIVTRFVGAGERSNGLDRDVQPGEVFYRFRGVTWGCVNEEAEEALIESGGEAFFTLPLDAIADDVPDAGEPA